MEKRRKRGGETSSDDDYGFYYPFSLVERLYWERYNANGGVYPEQGGMIDQDEHLMADIATYGWLVMFAENILDKQDEKSKNKDKRR